LETLTVAGKGRSSQMISAVIERCAGIDVAKKVLNVCVLTGAAADEPAVELRQFGSFTEDLRRLREWLLASGCTHVVMESTGNYWKPIFEALEDGLQVWLANGEDVKARKGHKTDWIDCQFLAHLLRHGLIRPSFIPPRAIRDLRDLTRRRRALTADAVSERNRVQKVLDAANVKLGNVLSDVFGVSGQLMLEKLLEGEPDVTVIASLAQRKAKAKIPELIRALEGHTLRDHHRQLIRYSFEHLAFLEAQIAHLDEQVLRLIEESGYGRSLELLSSVPGIQQISAAAVLAETGADMSVFPSSGHLSSWTGLAPGNHISGGKGRPTQCTRGNRWLRTTLVECAWAASKAKNGQFRELFGRLSSKGKKKALIAVAHRLTITIFNCLAQGRPYLESCEPLLPEAKRQRLIRHYVRRLGKLGVAVAPLSPARSRINKSAVGTTTHFQAPTHSPPNP